MCKGKSLVEKSELSELTLDHLINIEIKAAYSKGFMKGYNQAEVLINPRLEADNLAFFHVTCDVLAKEGNSYE